MIDDADADPKSVRRVILCSGKIYIDLVSSKFRAAAKDVALVRVEQLYPVPADDLRPVIKRYAQAEEVVWTQEEPENMGAWEFARPLLADLLAGHSARYLAAREFQPGGRVAGSTQL